MTKEARNNLIEKLEIMQGHGQFDGFNEENIIFQNLNDNELSYYEEWTHGQFDGE